MSIKYDIVELHNKQANPEAAFQYSRVLYTETVHSSSFIHTAAQPMLIPGMRYAWRVRAIAKEGIEEVPVIKNNGYSQVFYFDYAADCRQVQTLGAIYENNHVNITWQDVNAMEYQVEYRKKGSDKWYTGNITQPSLCPVYNLSFGKEYEYRIGTRCVINDVFQYSAIKSIQIPDKAEKGPDCGIMPDTKITNKVPAQQLQQGLPVLAGDFPVFITKVSGSGRFSGEGYVGIPYIGNARIAVTFSNIVVNTDNRLIEGYFETKYDAVHNLLFDADKAPTGGAGVGNNTNYTVDYTIDSNISVIPVKPDGTKDEIAEGGDYTITKGENGKYTFIITDSEGNEHKIEADEMPVTITDASGNTYQIDEHGNMILTNDNSEEGINTEDKSLSLIDREKLLWTFLQPTPADSLFNNHTLHLVQKTEDFSPVLILGHSEKMVSLFANDLYKNFKIINYQTANQLDSIVWEQTNNEDVVIERDFGFAFLPDIDNVGNYTLAIDAQKAFNYIFTYELDSITHEQRDTLIAGTNFAESLKMNIYLNISETGQLLFKPVNNDYHEHYGFDDAMQEKCRQSGDYEELSINGSAYYVPWLGVLPNEETEIKLEYTLSAFDIDILKDKFKIILECDNAKLLIDEQDKPQEYRLFDSKNIKLTAKESGIYELKAYLIDQAGSKIQIGKLKVESQGLKPAMKVQIIRVKRSNEDSYPPEVNKTQLINEVNKLYRQSFNQFVLDNAIYTDMLTIQKTDQDTINVEYFNTIGWTFESDIYYLYVLKEGVNKNQGEGNMPHRAHDGYPQNLTKTLVLLGNTDYDNAAHELGHILGLKHTFEPYINNEEFNYINVLTHKNRTTIEPYSTRNIMDYIIEGEPVTQRRYFFKYQIEHLK